jgi:hypothetical protein
MFYTLFSYSYCIKKTKETEDITKQFWNSLQLSVHAGSSLVDCFYPEDGGDTFLRNVG